MINNKKDYLYNTTIKSQTNKKINNKILILLQIMIKKIKKKFNKMN